MASCATSAPTEKIKTPETCEPFSAYLAQSQEGDCHEREETASSFLWRTVLRDNELWNIGQLEDCEFFFFPRQKDVRLFVFSTFFVNAHASWGWFIVKSPKICWFSCSAGLHTVFVLWGFCAFCKSIGLFTNIGSQPPPPLQASIICFYPFVVHILSWFFIIFYHIVLFFYTYIYSSSKPVHMLFFFLNCLILLIFFPRFINIIWESKTVQQRRASWI